MKTSVVTMLFLCLLISATSLQAQTWSAEEKEVVQAIKDCDIAYKAQDLEALSPCYHDDYVRFRRGAPSTFNKADILDYTPLTWANEVLVKRYIKPLAIRIVSNVAVIHYYAYALVKDKEGNEINRRQRFTDVWVKEEGRWSKIADHGGSDLPPGN
jgi:ketosteroid isomerase-like protein